MDLPTAVKAYFDADKGGDPEMLVSAFAPHAVVEDEGRRHLGHEAVRAWWLAAKAKYCHVADPVASRLDGSRMFVRARVIGNFPSSPAMLDYDFTLEDGLIAKVRIG